MRVRVGVNVIDLNHVVCMRYSRRCKTLEFRLRCGTYVEYDMGKEEAEVFLSAFAEKSHPYR